jgi:hypothetical protein
MQKNDQISVVLIILVFVSCFFCTLFFYFKIQKFLKILYKYVIRMAVSKNHPISANPRFTYKGNFSVSIFKIPFTLLVKCSIYLFPKIKFGCKKPDLGNCRKSLSIKITSRPFKILGSVCR